MEKRWRASPSTVDGGRRNVRRGTGGKHLEIAEDEDRTSSGIRMGIMHEREIRWIIRGDNNWCQYLERLWLATAYIYSLRSTDFDFQML